MPVAAPIGGLLLSSYGGVLGFKPFQGLLPSAGVVPPTVGQNLLDVERFEIARTTFEDDTTHSGSWAAQGTDVACIGWRAAAEILWDIRNPPNFLVESGMLAAEPWPKSAGYWIWFYVGSGINYPSDTPPYFYFSPSAKCRACATVVDSAGKRKVRARLDIMGNAPLFALGGANIDLGNYNAYIAHCITRGWVW